MPAENRDLVAIEEQIAHVLEYMQELEPVVIRMSQRPGRTLAEAEDLLTIKRCLAEARKARELYSQLWHARNGNGNGTQ